MTDQARANVKRLRIEYAAAIAATRAIEESATSRAELREFIAASSNEQEAGRAFLEALDTADPACSACGCTMFNPCAPPCAWVSMDPPLCSSCAMKSQFATNNASTVPER